MEYNVNKLLNILVIYQSLIRQKLIDSNYSKKGQKLSNEIDNLRNIYSSRGDLYLFDYKNLSRDIASIFHPDIFKPLNGIIDNPDSVLAETFGIIDDIMKLIKDYEKNKSKAEPFHYNYGTDTYSDSNSHNNANNNANNNDNMNYNDIDEDDNYEWNNEETDSGIYGTYTLVEFVKERFNAIFKGIPSNSKDYFNIKKRLEKSISFLKNQLDIIDKGILVLAKEFDNNKINWKKETSDSEIEIIYQRNLNHLYRQMKELEKAYSESQKELENEETLFEPTIDYQFSLWQKEANEHINKYNRYMYMYNLKKDNNPNADLGNLIKQINNMHSDIIIKYSNSIKAYNDIKKLILNSNGAYRDVQLYVKKAYNRYQNMCRRYNGYCENSSSQKNAIKKGVNARFFISEKKIVIALKGQKRQRNSIFAKLEKAKEKYNDFCSNYKNMYEESEKRK